MRIAWFSPPPTSEGTKAQYFSELVLPMLRELFDIELFGDGECHPTLAAYQAGYRRHRENPFDLFFYQVEDHPSNAFARMHLGLIPGIVLFHDVLFTTKAPEALLHSPWELICAGLKSGKSVELPPGEVWPEKHTPFGLRETHLSHLSLFTNPWAHGEFQRQVNGAGLSEKSFYVPFPVVLSEATTRPPTRSIGFSGAPSMEYRAHKLLQALAALTSPPELVWLLDEREEEWARALCRDFAVSKVRFIHGRSPSAWQKLLPEISVAVHTLHSVYGGLGPYLELSLAYGTPCITTRFGAGEHVPHLATVQIDSGDSEASLLEAALSALLVDAPWGAAKEYVREVHDVSVVAHELAALFRREAGALREKRQAWEGMQQSWSSTVLNTVLESEEPEVQALMEREFRAMGWRA